MCTEAISMWLFTSISAETWSTRGSWRAVRGGGCVQWCRLPRALPAPLLSQNIWESARTSAPGTGHWRQAVLLMQLLSQQQAAVGKGKNGLIALLLFFHGVSHAVASTVAFGMFPRWWFMGVIGFHKRLMFSVSPCLQGKNITWPVLCFPHLHFFIALPLQPIKSHFKKYGGRKATVCCIFISLKLPWSSWNNEKLETAKKKAARKMGTSESLPLVPLASPQHLSFHFVQQ